MTRRWKSREEEEQKKKPKKRKRNTRDVHFYANDDPMTMWNGQFFLSTSNIAPSIFCFAAILIAGGCRPCRKRWNCKKVEFLGCVSRSDWIRSFFFHFFLFMIHLFFFLSLNDSKERCGRRWNMNGIKRRVTAIRQCVPRNRKKTLPHRYIPHTLKKKLGKTWLRSAELTLNRLSGLNIGDRGRLFALISKLDVIIGISHSKRNHGCRVDRVSLRRSVGRIPLPAARPKRTRQRDWLRSGSRRRRCSGRCTCGNGCPVFFSNTMMDRLKSSRKIFQFSLFNKVLSSFELVSKLPPLSRFYFFANPEFNWFFAWVVTPDKWIAK